MATEPLHPTPTPAPARPPIPVLLGPNEAATAWLQREQAAREARLGNRPTGPISGFAAFDKALGGGFRPGTHFILGVAGSGKTSLLSTISGQSGTPALFVSAEMPGIELFTRHVSRVTQTPLSNLRGGALAAAILAGLAERTIEALPHFYIGDACRGGATVAWIRDAALVAKGNDKHVLIGIDSLHSWAMSLATGGDEYSALNDATNALRELSLELGCAIVCIAERNRSSMATGGLHSGAGTRRIEYTAESVISLDVDKSAPLSRNGDTKITLTIGKNRSGESGQKLSLWFDGSHQTFREC